MRLKLRWSEADWQKLEKSYRQDPIGSPTDRLYRSGRAVDQFGGGWVTRVKLAPETVRPVKPSDAGAAGIAGAPQSPKEPKRKAPDRLHASLLREIIMDEATQGYLMTVNEREEVTAVKVLRTLEEWNGAKAVLPAGEGSNR
ncbi:MAG: hypothetical protein HY554_00880 [Elusimicrobia bacterium]|nr:hypothetical protein [Elusimicrobiota bacterium]